MSSKSKKGKKSKETKSKDTKAKKTKSSPKAKKTKPESKKKNKNKNMDKSNKKDKGKDKKLKKKKHNRMRSKSTHEVISPKNKKKKKKNQKRRASQHSKDDTTIIHTKVLVAHRESLSYKEGSNNNSKLKRGVTIPKDIANEANSSIIAKKGKMAKLHKEEQNALDGLRQHRVDKSAYIPHTHTPSSRDFQSESLVPPKEIIQDEDVDDEKVQKVKLNDEQNKIEALNKEKEVLERKVDDLKHQLSTMTGIVAKDKSLYETLEALQSKVDGLNKEVAKQAKVTTQVWMSEANSDANIVWVYDIDNG